MKKLIFLLLSIIILSCQVSKKTSENFERYLPQSDFVFEGEIINKNASTIVVFDVSQLILVKISEILKKTDEFDTYAGDTITIKVTDIDKFRNGDKQIFFTKGWIFGNGIGVLEIGSSKSKLDIVTIRDLLAKEMSKMRTRLLNQSVTASDLIVTGKIIKIAVDTVHIAITEHDPVWRRATITVDRVIKGPPGLTSVEFLFASSIDVMWYFSPKFKEMEDGIWLLTIPGQLLGYPKNQNYTLLDKNDFLTLDILPQILELTKPTTIKNAKQ